MPPKEDRLWISLPKVTLEDGNYRDFRVGREGRFALEFYARSMDRAEPTGILRDHLEGARYQFCAPVIYRSDEPSPWVTGDGEHRDHTRNVCILDLGVPAYYEDHNSYHLPPAARVGTWWSGELCLMVDFYPYFEYLYKQPGIPPLIYPWRIERILADRTPRVLKVDARIGGYMGPDETREAWVDVPATDDYSQLDHNYLFECTRTGEASRERLLAPSATEREAIRDLVGVGVELYLTGPAEHVAEHGPGPHLATFLQVSEKHPEEQGGLLRLQTPLHYQGNGHDLIQAWPRYEGEGIGHLTAGDDWACILRLMPPGFDASDNPFGCRARPPCRFQAWMRCV